MSDPLHVAITRNVNPGCGSPFEEAILRFVASSFSHAGTLGAYLLRLLHGLEAFFRQGPDGCGGALLVGWMPMRIVGAEK